MENVSHKNILLELSIRVKRLRQKHNLTQAECYNDTGINFGRIERGNRDISFTTLYKLCDYFNVELEYFLKDFKIHPKEEDKSQ